MTSRCSIEAASGAPAGGSGTLSPTTSRSCPSTRCPAAPPSTAATYSSTRALTKPAVFEGPVEGWWYVDLVEIDHTDTGLVVRDLYVDLLIPPAANRYQLLDLDEFADALTAGQITPIQCATVLHQTQQFINRYLRGPEEGPSGPQYQFPPTAVTTLESLRSFLDPPA